ncbi:MAG: dihydropteroate synthase [Coriobacteriales bacterium]|jgi:5-methyltetrahydrofolate--homocysteine methyltransferase|nr:dihydropteroate synthase [Coriobacteriales bacterium]
MIIIGEKINGFIPKTLAAIESKDSDYIRTIAQAQEVGGAAYLDICAGVAPEIERETLQWLIDIALSAADVPLCLDSSDPSMLVEMYEYVQEKANGRQASEGLINSVSLEEGKCEAIFPVIAAGKWGVVALTCDNNGIPDDPEVKLQLARELIKRAGDAGIGPERLFIDPLVTTLATKQDSLINFNDGIKLIKAEFPTVHFTSGLSNISFGMPYRKAINMQFLSLAMVAGMDSAIMDPTSSDMQATLHATAALLGQDEYCMEYLTAYRAGLFGTAPKPA